MSHFIFQLHKTIFRIQHAVFQKEEVFSKKAILFSETENYNSTLVNRIFHYYLPFWVSISWNLEIQNGIHLFLNQRVNLSKLLIYFKLLNDYFRGLKYDIISCYILNALFNFSASQDLFRIQSAIFQKQSSISQMDHLVFRNWKLQLHCSKSYFSEKNTSSPIFIAQKK